MLALVSVAILAIIGLGLSGCSNVEIFTDSTGVEWRVLTVDDYGNRLIITERNAYGLDPADGFLRVPYNTEDIYTRLNDSDGLRPALNDWFSTVLAPELRKLALPAENVNNDVREAGEWFGDFEAFSSMRNENEPAGWTFAGSGEATPENSLFVLSISEVNKYRNLGTLNLNDAFFWLRSPGFSDKHRVAVMVVSDTERLPIVSSTRAFHKFGFRPALWVSAAISD
jgi:hypothetical protein